MDPVRVSHCISEEVGSGGILCLMESLPQASDFVPVFLQLGKGNLRESFILTPTLPSNVSATSISLSATSPVKELAKGILLGVNGEAEWPIHGVSVAVIKMSPSPPPSRSLSLISSLPHLTWTCRGTSEHLGHVLFSRESIWDSALGRKCMLNHTNDCRFSPLQNHFACSRLGNETSAKG